MFRRLTIALALLLQGLAYAETRDLILVAGQSNAVGFDAYAEELPADPKDAATMFWWRVGDPPPDEFDGTSARQWTTLQFQPRTQAMEGDAAKKLGRQYGNFNKKTKGGFGPEIGMVRTLATKESRPLAVIKTAFSGTSVAADWNVGLPGKADACYRAMIDFSRDFTIATWVNVGNYYAEMPVLFKGRADKTTAPDKFFGVFGIEGMQVQGEGQGEWITNFRASNGLVPNDGQWHHVAVTYRAKETPHFMLYLDGQGKTPADKGSLRGGDFTLKPDAPDSVLRIGCRADGDTWRYVRSHLRGLLDELQIYDEALKTEDIRFLFEHPGRTTKQREAATFAPRFQFDPGHPWRPQFGVERVGLTPVIVQFASDTHPAPEHWLA